MNLKSRLRHLADKSGQVRQYGKTTLIAKACADLQGVMVAASHDHARDLQRKYGIVSKSIDLNLDDHNGPIFFDHYAIEKLLYRSADKIEALEKELETKDEKIKNLEFFIERMKKREENNG